MRQYEAMFIFRVSLKEEVLKEGVEEVRAEVERQGGTVRGVEEIGKRMFARQFRKAKCDSGQFVRIAFDMDPEKVDAFRRRFRHREEVVRIQIIAVKAGQGAAGEKRERPVKEAADDDVAEPSVSRG